MTTLKVIVEDDQAGLLKKLLQEVSFVKSVEEYLIESDDILDNESPIERIEKALEAAKGQNLFKDIPDPSEWQREIRKEWDRDF